MTRLSDFLDVVNESTNIILYDANQEIIGQYDGIEEIPEEYEHILLNDIFADCIDVTTTEEGPVRVIGAIGIEIQCYRG